MQNKIVVIIPAYNEEKSIGKVILAIPDSVEEIIVVNNNSSDNTLLEAKNAGATVLTETESGYGAACLKGISYVDEMTIKPHIVVFIDGDYSDYPEQLHDLVYPIIHQNMDLVIGSRALGKKDKGSMTPQQVFGNWLATFLIRTIYNYHFTDLGPFRAIKYEALKKIDMKDRDYGWTVEMQVKAAKLKLNCTEVAVDYRKRIGVSKVSGTVKGTIMAGYKIITTIFKLI